MSKTKYETPFHMQRKMAAFAKCLVHSGLAKITMNNGDVQEGGIECVSFRVIVVELPWNGGTDYNVIPLAEVASICGAIG